MSARNLPTQGETFNPTDLLPMMLHGLIEDLALGIRRGFLDHKGKPTGKKATTPGEAVDYPIAMQAAADLDNGAAQTLCLVVAKQGASLRGIDRVVRRAVQVSQDRGLNRPGTSRKAAA